MPAKRADAHTSKIGFSFGWRWPLSPATVAATITNTMSKLIDEIDDHIRAGGKVVFWVCPRGCDGTVTWQHGKNKSVATCGTCGARSDTPVRVQRQRNAELPHNTVYVGQRGPYANPFVTVEQYETLMAYAQRGQAQVTDGVMMVIDSNGKTAKVATIATIKKELRGKNLSCWCPLGTPCHADILLKIANEP